MCYSQKYVDRDDHSSLGLVFWFCPVSFVSMKENLSATTNNGILDNVFSLVATV